MDFQSPWQMMIHLLRLSLGKGNIFYRFALTWEIPDDLTCPLRNLDEGQEATVRAGHGTTDWFQKGKGVCQGCISSPCLFNLYAEYIMKHAGMEDT